MIENLFEIKVGVKHLLMSLKCEISFVGKNR